MDWTQMISKLKTAGIVFETGMTDPELDKAEVFFQFRFPREIREFFSVGVPVGSSFFNYRDLSPDNLKRFCDFQDSVEEGFRFDLEMNREAIIGMLEMRLAVDSDFVDDAVMTYLRRSVRLIPFYGHRCFFDGMDDMPMISFWQATDVIFYGGTFENYLEHEFLKGDRVLQNIEERMINTGIWKDIIG